MMRFLRPLIIAAGLVLLWQIIVWLTGAPHFILPAPADVAIAWWQNHLTILGHAGVTLLEIALGLLLPQLLQKGPHWLAEVQRDLRPCHGHIEKVQCLRDIRRLRRIPRRFQRESLFA